MNDKTSIESMPDAEMARIEKLLERRRKKNQLSASKDDNADETKPQTEIQPSTEDGIAEAFAQENSTSLKYCRDFGDWFIWQPNSHVWERDATRNVFHSIREKMRSFNPDDKPVLAKSATAAGIERFCEADPRFATTADDWDSNVMLLGTPEGIINLTGSKPPDERLCFITKSTAVAPLPGKPEKWLKFLDEITCGSADLIQYLQRLCGYCLTGSIRENAVVFIYGPGGNGKSVFLKILLYILHEYAKTAAIDTFLETRHDGHPTDIASLAGSRLVTASESEEGRTWKTSLIKSVTGGEPVTARFMRQNNFTFQPQFKLIITSNYKPRLRSVDDAMKRRLHVIPFRYKPENPDKDLFEKLQSEAAQILGWMIDGARDWLKHGLEKPEIVRAETDEYFQTQDTFGAWLDERCERRDDADTPSSALYNSWKEYAESAGLRAGSTILFSGALEQRGFTKDRCREYVFWRGIALNAIKTGVTP